MSLAGRISSFVRIVIAHLVLEHKDVIVIHEVFVDILKRTASCFRIEQIHEWHEGPVEDGPDDVEFPAESSDADGSDFDDDEVAWSIVVSMSTERSYVTKTPTHPVGGRSQRSALVFHR